MLLTVMLTILCLPMLAVFVQPQDAQEVAQNWINYWNPNKSSITSLTMIKAFQDNNMVPAESSYATERSDLPAFYLFYFDNGAFSIVAAEDNSIPILAYGFDCVENPDDIAPATQMWMNHYASEILSLRETKTEISENQIKWQDISSGNFSRFDDGRAVDALVAARWNQDFPYNELCPLDPSGPGGRVYAGCVATAMGMVMKYWNKPITGQGSNTYYASGYGYQTANFGTTTYLWDEMPNSASGSNIPIATLLYHLGVSVNMNYAPDGSGSNGNYASAAMRTNFRYPNATLHQRGSYSATNWENLIKDQLDNGVPMYYSGSDQQVGHAWACDGYQGTNYFHFNFGWSGSYDGFYYLTSITPGGNTLTLNQAAIINAIPANYSIASPRIRILSNLAMVGDPLQISLATYPVLTDWNVSSYSFQFFYDHTNIDYLGYSIDGTISAGGDVQISQIEPGLLSVSWNRSTALFGGGTLINLNLIVNEPGEYYFDAINMTYNSTPLTTVDHLISTIVAPVENLAESSITLTNAMQVGYHQIASMELRTSHLLPSWNVQSYNFNVTYDPSKVEYYGLDVSATLSEGCTPVGVVNTPGTVEISCTSDNALFGSGALLKLLFRAIGNGASSTVAQIHPGAFFYNQTSIASVSGGFIVLAPSTANEDPLAMPAITLNAYPNPFNPSSSIRFSTSKNAAVGISVYNLKGQLIKQLVNTQLPIGEHSITWNGTDEGGNIQASGIYFVRLSHDNQSRTIKLLMLK